MELGKAKLDVVVDSSGARSGVDAANRAFEQLKNKGEQATKGLFDSFSKLKDKIFSLQGAIASIGLGLLAKSFIDAGKQTENMTIRLQVLLGSVSEGKRLFKEMNEYAAKTPFEFNEVMNSATNLAAVLKGGVDEVKGYMPLIADLSAAAGIGIEQATQNVVKMLSAGAAAADSFRERGVLAMLGFQQGVKYSAEETRKILIEAWESPQSKFRDAAKLLVSTWDGAMSNLADSWFQFQQRVMIDGGVLDYMKAVVQVISGELTDSFGAPTGKAEELGRNMIEMGRSGVKALGAMIEAGKFVVVAFEAIKTSLTGINTLIAASNANGADMAAKFRHIQSEMARQALKEAESFGTQARIEEARNRLREALVVETKAWQAASAAQDEYIQSAEDNTAQVDMMFEAYKSFEEGVNFDDFLNKVNAQFEANKKASEGATASLGKFNSGLLDFEGPAGESQKDMKELAKAAKEFGDDVDQLVKKYDDLGEAELTRSQSLGLLSQAVFAGKITGEAYQRILAAINLEYEEAIKDGDKWGQVLEDVKEKYVAGYAASKTYHAELANIEELHKQGKLTGPEYAAALKGVTTEYQNAAISAKEVSKETQAYLQIMQSAQGQLEGTFSNFFYNIFNDGIKSFKSLGDGILDMFKRMLAEMAVMAIANPIIVPIVQSAGNMLGGFFGQQGAGNAYVQAYQQANGGGFSSLLGSGSSGSSLWSSASNLYNNFWNTGLTSTGPWAASGGLGAGSYVTPTGFNAVTGATEYGTSFVPNYAAGAPSTYAGGAGAYPMAGGTTNIGGWGASTWGLAGAGIGLGYGLTRGSGGLSTGLAGATGAVAGYGVGVGAAAAFGAAGAGAGAGAAAAAGMAAIPVVGWIALAILAIDSISGGRLFGTKYKTKEVLQGIKIDEEGGTAYAQLYQTRHRALFGGDAHRYKDVDPGDELRDQAQQIFEQWQKVQLDAMKELGVSAAEVVAGSFDQTYDAKGKLKKESSTFFGKTYEEDFEAFSKRGLAENIIAVVGKQSADAHDIAERWRDNADLLMDGATVMLQAQSDLNKGIGILGNDGTLRQTIDIIEELQKSDESLVDAYTRLREATRGYNELIDSLGVTIKRSGADLVRFASDFVDAAGGTERANALYQSFQDNYFSQDEKNNNTRFGLNEAIIREVGDLGSAGKDLTYENFRQRFTEALPTLTAEQLKDWLEAGDALAQLAKQLGRSAISASSLKGTLEGYSDSLSDFQDMLVTTTTTAHDSLNDSMNNIIEMSHSYDGSIEQEGRLMGLLQMRYEQEIQYLTMIENIQRSLNSTLDNSIESIRMSQMSIEGQYEYLRQQANDLADQLVSMTDPEQINATVNQINELQGRAWGLLTEDQRQSMASEFIHFLEGIQDIANENLDTARQDVGTQNQTISQAIEEALKGAGERFENSASLQSASTDRFVEAVDTFAATEVRVVLVDNRGQVGGLTP